VKNLRSWKELDRFLETRVGRHRLRGGAGGRTHPSKSQGHLKHEMGSEYNQEVPGRILRDGSQNGANF